MPQVRIPPPAPVAPPTPAAEPAKPTPDLAALIYPHAQGDTWQMRMSGEAETHLVTLTVLPAQAGEPTGFRLETKRDGIVVARDRYTADEHGVYLSAQGYPGETRVEPPMPILKLPMVAGTTWAWKGAFKAAGGAVPAEATFTVAGPEGVDTPAGAFQAYRVEQKLTFRAKTGRLVSTTTQWLAPKVGLVKQTVETPETRGEAVLVSYRLANATAAPATPGAPVPGGPPVRGGGATTGGGLPGSGMPAGR